MPVYGVTAEITIVLSHIRYRRKAIIGGSYGKSPPLTSKTLSIAAEEGDPGTQ
jgi:hypothetical protein